MCLTQRPLQQELNVPVMTLPPADCLLFGVSEFRRRWSGGDFGLSNDDDVTMLVFEYILHLAQRPGVVALTRSSRSVRADAERLAHLSIHTMSALAPA